MVEGTCTGRVGWILTVFHKPAHNGKYVADASRWEQRSKQVDMCVIKVLFCQVEVVQQCQGVPVNLDVLGGDA